MLHGSQGRRPPTLTVGEARARVCSAAALSASPLNQQSAQGLTLGKEWLLSREAAQGKGGNQLSGAYTAHLEVRRRDDLHWGPKWVPRWKTVVQVSPLDQQFHNKPGISWKKGSPKPKKPIPCRLEKRCRTDCAILRTVSRTISIILIC